ncbi:MAG: leucine-rich repeat domain-containing protein [Bacteroidales bacterium]|nr:leucine-rich repeat domain-containing protein [Bacteroidales bacterium]
MRIAAAMLFAVAMFATASAFAQTTSGTCGENATWVYDESMHILTISGTGEMSNYSSAPAPWNNIKDNIQTVVISEGITSIGEYAFCYAAITNVSIPDGVTTIGDYAFYYCKSIGTVTIPNGVTSIGRKAFLMVRHIDYYGNAIDEQNNYWGANSLNGISDGDFVYLDDTKSKLIAYIGKGGVVEIPRNVAEIGAKTFYGCSFIRHITIPDGVTSIGDYAFTNCDGLKNVTIPDRVSSIGEKAFDHVPNIEYYGNAEGSPWGARCRNGYIEGDFVYSDNTKKEIRRYVGEGSEIVIPDGVTSIGNNAFNYAVSNRSITSITIPESVTTIGDHAFFSTDITSLTIPKNVTSIGNMAFDYNKKLESIYLNNDPSKCVFGGCMVDSDPVRFYVLPEYLNLWSEFYPWDQDGAIFLLYGEEYTQNGVIYILSDNGQASVYSHTSDLPNDLVIPETITKDGKDYRVVTICNQFAYRTENLTSVDIPEGVKSIGRLAFSYCKNLKSAVIPEGVTHIGKYAFDGCGQLRMPLTIPGSVTIIDISAFNGCAASDVYCYADFGKINFKELEGKFSRSTIFHVFIGDLDKWKEKYKNVMFSFVDDIKRLSDESITIPAQTYTSTDLTPVVKDGEKTLVEGEDYTVTLPDGGCINAGEYTLTLIGKNPLYYNGEKKFTITPKSLSADGISIAAIPAQTYTGAALEPAISVTDGNTALDKGKDYTVEYTDNTNAGTATAKIIGKGNYSGNIEKTFVINPAPVTATDDITLSSVKIWSFNKTIFVENAAQEIVIVDMSGRIVKTIKPESSRTEIQLEKSGVYIVKTGIKTQKVSIQ